MTFTLAEAIVEVHGDPSRLRPEVVPAAEKVGKESGEKMGKGLGASLNAALKKLDVEDIPIGADPRKAVKAIADTKSQLRDLSRFASTVEVKIQAEKGLRELARFEKQLGDVEDEAGDLNEILERLKLKEIDINAEGALEEIDRTEAKLRELTKKPYTAEVRVEAERGLRELDGLKKRLAKAGDDSGPSFVKNFGAKVGQGLSSLSLSPPMAIAVAAAGVSVAPLLGGIIAGSIIGQAGALGVVGGITVAAKDERVKDAIGGLGTQLETRLQGAAGKFVPATLKGISIIQRAIQKIDIEGALNNSAAFVEPLAQGIGSLVTSIGNGLTGLIAIAGPVMAQISEGFARIGDAVEDGLGSLSDNSNEAATAMKVLFLLIEGGIRTVFHIVNVLTELYGIVHKLGIDSLFLNLLKLTGVELNRTKGATEGATAAVTGLGDGLEVAKEDTLAYKQAQEQVTAATKELQVVQKALQGDLDSLGGKMSGAELRASSLKTAMDNLYGAAINQTEANEAFEASFDALSTAIGENAKKTDENATSLDIHTQAGRSNRDALQDLLTKNNQLYIADIAAGKSVEYATGQHRKRTEQVRKESIRLGLNDKETDKLIKTYGRIPGEKTTDLVLDGVREVVSQLRKLYIYQRSLATGKSIESVEDTLRKGNDAGPSKSGGFAHGGRYGGRIPGAPSPVDNMHGRGPHGEEIRLAGGEWIVNAKQSAKYDELLDGINRGVVGLANGGTYPVDASRRWPFMTTVDKTRIPSRKEVASKVVLPFGPGNWPASPAAQRGDSGVWRKVVALIRSTGPLSGAFGNAYRPGDPLWHGSGRAVDWMGFNQDALASFLARRRPLELIHRTANRDYAYTRGQNMGSFDAGTMNEHLNHIHVAFRKGGKFLATASKAATFDYGGTLAPGLNVVNNQTGGPEPLRPADQLGEVHIHLHNAVIASKQQFEDMLVGAYKSAVSKKRLPKVAS